MLKKYCKCEAGVLTSMLATAGDLQNKMPAVASVDCLLEGDDWVSAWTAMLTADTAQHALIMGRQICDDNAACAAKVEKSDDVPESEAVVKATGSDDPLADKKKDDERLVRLQEHIDFFRWDCGDGTFVAASAMQCFLSGVTAFLHHRYTFNKASMDKGCNALAFTKAGDLVALSQSKEISLMFFGHATTLPSKGCLPLCDMFGQKIYIDGSAFKNLSGDTLVPAWNVVRAGQKGGRNATADISMKIVSEKIDYVNKYSTGQGAVAVDKSSKVELTIFRAKVTPSMFSKKDKQEDSKTYSLSRPIIDGEVVADVKSIRSAREWWTKQKGVGSIVKKKLKVNVMHKAYDGSEASMQHLIS